MRSILSFVLSLSLAIPPHAFAQTGIPGEEDILEASKHLSEKEQQTLQHILKESGTLREAFADPTSSIHPLDDFDLIQQDVVDLRREKVNDRIAQIVSKNFAVQRQEEVNFMREEALKNPSRAIEFIGSQRVLTAALHLGLDMQKDLIQIIDAAATDDEVANILDIKPDEIEHFVDEELPPRRLYRMNLKVNVLKIGAETDELLETLNQKDAEGSTAASFNSENFHIAPKGSLHRFEITTSKGEVIHRFNRPISAVGFYGRFLIYVDHEVSGLRVIDLDYFKGAIGNTPLASFHVPLKASEITQLEIKNGQLVINGNPMPYNGLMYITDLYQAYFNIKVALVDPATASSASNLIKELVYFKDQALKEMDQLESQMIDSALGGSEVFNSLTGQMQKNLTAQAEAGPMSDAKEIPEKLNKAFAENPEMLLTFNPTIKVIEKEVLSQNRLQQVNRSTMVSRQFFSRLHLLMAKLSHPQPMGSPKLIQGMIMLGESALARKWSQFKSNWKSLKTHPVIAYGRFGAPALAAAAIGATISDSFALTIYESLQMGQAAVLGYLNHTDFGKNFVELGGMAAETALSGIPSSMKYFTEEYAGRIGVLAMAMFGLIVGIYGSLHITANISTAVSYFSSHRGWRKKARSEGLSVLGSYRAVFVKYQNALKLSYDRALSKSEAGAAKSSSVKFNSAQDEIAEEQLKELKKKPGMISRILSSLKWSKKATDDVTVTLEDAGNKSVEFQESLKKNTHLNRITTLRSAFSQFALSYPATIVTSRFNGKLWNYWFMIRNFALVPRSWPMFLTYPEMFRVAISGQKDRLHMPSKLNGGYRSDIDNVKFVFRNLNTDRTLKDLKNLEKAILPIEGLAYEVALEKSLEVLIREVKDKDQLMQFFDSSALPKSGMEPGAVMRGAPPSTGIRSISDPKIGKLSKKNQTFFRAVFNQLYEKTTETYLREYMSSIDPSAVAQASNTAELKDAGIDMTLQLESLNRSLQNGQTPAVQKRMKEIAIEHLNDGLIVEDAKKVATSITKFGERLLINSEHKVMQKLNPNSPQVGRFKLAERKLKDVKSVIRAINAMGTEMFERFLGLGTILIMYSAVSSGMLAPIQEEMFGPNSWFYGSRYLFLNGFATGLIMSAMASVWMKVQMDDRIDATGSFDKVPSIEDRDKSYLRYYLKSFWKNPANKWSSNQLNAMKIAWANLSAAFVTIAAANFLSLGRFDLGSFMTGYAIVFLTPLSGIDYKLDQTHELASRWQASKVARKLRAHPKMLSWVNKHTLLKRYPHTGVTFLYGFFMGPFLSLYELMDTEKFGKRSFLNLVFNGYQPEEIVSAGLQKVNKYLGFVPGVEQVTEFCENLLTNNNTALDPSKLMNPPTSGN